MTDAQTSTKTKAVRVLLGCILALVLALWAAEGCSSRRLASARDRAKAAGMLLELKRVPSGQSTAISIYKQISAAARGVPKSLREYKSVDPPTDAKLAAERRAWFQPLLLEIEEANRLPLPTNTAETNVAGTGLGVLMLAATEEVKGLLKEGKADQALRTLRSCLQFSTRLYTLPSSTQTMIALLLEEILVRSVLEIAQDNPSNRELIAKLAALMDEAWDAPGNPATFATMPIELHRSFANPNGWEGVLKSSWVCEQVETTLLEDFTETYRQLPKSIADWPKVRGLVRANEQKSKSSTSFIGKIAAKYTYTVADQMDLFCDQYTNRLLVQTTLHIAAQGKPWPVGIPVSAEHIKDPYSTTDGKFRYTSTNTTFTVESEIAILGASRRSKALKTVFPGAQTK